MKSTPLFASLLLLAWLATSGRAHGKTSLTIVVANLPDSGSTANGQSIAFTFGGNVVHVFDPETGKNLEF